MWKGIYFVEVGNKEHQREDKERGSLRVCSDYGMKIWDDAGVACVVQKKLREQLPEVGERELSLLCELASPDGFALLSRLDAHDLVTKEELVESTGIEKHRLNELLLMFCENQIIEFAARERGDSCGYKLCGHFGIAAELVLAAAYVLSRRRNYAVSEYISYGY